jgi:hypothetical protein
MEIKRIEKLEKMMNKIEIRILKIWTDEKKIKTESLEKIKIEIKKNNEKINDEKLIKMVLKNLDERKVKLGYQKQQNNN